MNNTAKHTPGPWVVRAFEVNGKTRFEVLDNNGNSACVQANAHLIAAAPAMYEALQRLFNGNVDCGTYWQIDVSDIQAAKQAIAQAEGK